MGLLNLTRISVGEVGVKPGSVKMVDTNNLATITAAGYLNGISLATNISLAPSDVIECIYSYNEITDSGTLAYFQPSISNGVITLNIWENPGNVLLPVTSGDFATFNGTSGQIKDSGYVPSNPAKTTVVMAGSAVVANHIALFQDTTGTIDDTAATAINNGSIQAGVSGTAGTLASFPSGATSGELIVAAVTNTSGNFNTTISNATAVAQSQVVTIPDGGAATSQFVLSQSKIPTNQVSFTVIKTLTFTQLASAGKVNIVTHPSATSQFAVMDIKVLKSTGLSGGGGDRLLSVSDGTIVFNNAGITAALLGTPILTVWGGTDNPLAVGASEISTAGADIYFQYIGGTTDYTAGSVQVAVTLVQVTA